MNSRVASGPKPAGPKGIFGRRPGLQGGRIQELGPSALLPFFSLLTFFLPCRPTRAPRVGFPPGTKAGAAAWSAFEYPGNAGVAHGAHELSRVSTESGEESTTLRDGFKERSCNGCTWHRPLPAPEQPARLNPFSRLAPARVGSWVRTQPLRLSLWSAPLRALLLNLGQGGKLAARALSGW